MLNKAEKIPKPNFFRFNFIYGCLQSQKDPQYERVYQFFCCAVTNYYNKMPKISLYLLKT